MIKAAVVSTVNYLSDSIVSEELTEEELYQKITAGNQHFAIRQRDTVTVTLVNPIFKDRENCTGDRNAEGGDSEPCVGAVS